MELAGLDFTCMPSDVDETIPDGLPVERYTEYLSGVKAVDIAARHPEDTVIGSDTLVELDGEVLGKPHSRDEAAQMLCRLSGRTHRVFTGVTIISPKGRDSFTSVTEVEFYPLTDAQIEAYIATGEPMDKAGAYGIQGRGALLVRGIRGDYYTVMGLPIAEVVRHLERHI